MMKREDLIKKLNTHRDILKQFKVKDLYLFGSAARDEAKDTSDIDILVAFEPNAKVGMFDFIRLRRKLSNVLGCDVDLTTEDALHREMKADILKEAIHAA